jgi:hypothetical protein
MLIQLDECPACRGVHDRLHVTLTAGIMSGTCPTTLAGFTMRITTGDATGESRVPFSMGVPEAQPTTDDYDPFNHPGLDAPDGPMPKDG